MRRLKAFFPQREKDQDNPVIVLSKSTRNYTDGARNVLREASELHWSGSGDVNMGL